MKRLLDALGSLALAVALLIAIAAVLAWGTIYEARFGTAAVQRFVYQSWWFQSLLGFLAVNLAVVACSRWPWQRKHTPFLLAHLGIILILVGGIIGGRFGIEGQLIIPEGESQRMLVAPQHVLAVRQKNPGIEHEVPTRFETQAWLREPKWTIAVPLETRPLQLTVDRYLPDADVGERVVESSDGTAAVEIHLHHGDSDESTWLLADDPDRSIVGWGPMHVMLKRVSDQDLARWTGTEPSTASGRGVVRIRWTATGRTSTVPVPDSVGASVAIEGTPYRVTFKDFFPDFILGPHGPTSRSNDPNNPAIALVLQGPEGTDPYLLFALHPDFSTIHGIQHTIPSTLTYEHPKAQLLPPNAFAVLIRPTGRLLAVVTDDAGHRQAIDPLETGHRYPHPSGVEVELATWYPHARLTQDVVDRGDEIKHEALHVVATQGDKHVDAWLFDGVARELDLGPDPVIAEYRHASRRLPFTVKLLDFRRIQYPGIEMAAAFESDVEMSDPSRGLILMKTIKMNHPLKYRGYKLFQASYVDGPVETTVLAVRKDPGTPLVYAGFIIVIAGVVLMFVTRRPNDQPSMKESVA